MTDPQTRMTKPETLEDSTGRPLCEVSGLGLAWGQGLVVLPAGESADAARPGAYAVQRGGQAGALGPDSRMPASSITGICCHGK